MGADSYRDTWHLRLIVRPRQLLVDSLLYDLQLEALHDPLLENLTSEQASGFSFLEEISDRAVTSSHKHPDAALIVSQLKGYQRLRDLDLASPVSQNSSPPLAACLCLNWSAYSLEK